MYSGPSSIPHPGQRGEAVIGWRSVFVWACQPDPSSSSPCHFQNPNLRQLPIMYNPPRYMKAAEVRGHLIVVSSLVVYAPFYCSMYDNGRETS